MVFEAFLLLFARSLGFFFFSPLFRWQNIPPFLRFGIAATTTLLFAPIFLQEPKPVSFLGIRLFEEAVIGYLLGFLFSLLFEAAALAGEVVGAMMGISATELYAPSFTPASPLLSKAFALLIGALFFALDFHHILLRIFYESYSLLPSATLSFSSTTIDAIVEATSSLFSGMLEYALYPLFFLSLVLILLALSSRIFPDLPILWVGFPLQLLVGFFAIILALGGYSEILERSLLEIRQVIDRILSSLLYSPH